jgi:hypothetical protein
VEKKVFELAAIVPQEPKSLTGAPDLAVFHSPDGPFPTISLLFGGSLGHPAVEISAIEQGNLVRTEVQESEGKHHKSRHDFLLVGNADQ